MTIKELKLNYQSIVNDCRKAEKTGDEFLARVAAMNALELAQNTFIGVVADIAARNEARRLYHGAWNAIAYPLGEEGKKFMEGYSNE